MHRRIVRLALVVTTVAVVLLGVPSALVATALVRADEIARVERTALRGAGQVNSALGQGDALELPRTGGGAQLGIYDSSGARVAGDGPDRADAVTTAALEGRTGDAVEVGRTVVAVPVRDAEHVIGASRAAGSAGAVAQKTLQVVGAICAAGLLALVVAWLVARQAARRLSRPVAALAAVADAHASGDRLARAVPSGVAELDAVARGMNASADAVDEALTRERAFAAEASHQLRTPLTRVRWGLEAAIDADPGELRAAAALAIRDVAELDQSVNELLALTRTPAGETATTDAAAELERIADQWTGPLAEDGRRLLLVLDHDTSWHVAMSTDAVRHLLQVLLENAQAHGRGTVTLHLRDAVGTERDAVIALDVADEGEFRGDWPAPTGVVRGGGIGLLLGQRLAAQAGARLVLSTSDPTTVTLLVRRIALASAVNPRPRGT